MKSPTYNELTKSEMIDIILDFVKVNSEKYKISIGTDSQVQGMYVTFVTAIIVHRVGKGAIYFYDKKIVNKKFSLADRLFTEALYSIEMARDLINDIKMRQYVFNDNDLTNLEIHVDAGQNGETKNIVNSIVGMVKGSGFDVKIKPESYCASTVADKYTR